MIRLNRKTELLGTPSWRSFRGLRRPGLRIYTSTISRLTFEMNRVVATNEPSTMYVHCPWAVTMVLEGELVLRRGTEFTLRRGDAWCERIDTYDERWESGLRLLMLEWDERFGAAPPTGSLRLERQRSRLVAFADRLESHDPPEALVADFKGVLDALRSDGLPLREVNVEALAEVPPTVALVAAQLNLVFTGLPQRPTWVDLQATLSERHLRRLITAHREWFGLPGDSLRTALNAFRLQSAVSLLSVEGSKLEHIARSLGYRSDRALITALKRAGLGAPAEIRAALRR